ncbi:MAG TPA: rhodanese-like domain-containing protein [Gemmatimonadaceae bacterium]|nr:rhodanese-like domain-containing protein [Gemmatimonadaceae bacterium]
MRELRKAGWTNARVLVGGWAAWQQAGLPVERKPPVVMEQGAEAS